MATISNKDVVADGLKFLITQWADKPNIVGLLTSYLENIQDVEDIYQQLLTERNVYTAIGVQLDVVGIAVGEQRLGKNDVDYRQAILNRVATNAADGTPEKLLSILETITLSASARLFEHYPANIHAHVTGNATHVSAKTLQQISPAGVSSRLMFDAGVPSFQGAALVHEEFGLALENTDLLALENTDTLNVVATKVIPVGMNSYFPHTLNTQLINPMCPILDARVFNSETGNLVLENSDLFVLENGDTLTYQVIEEVT